MLRRRRRGGVRAPRRWARARRTADALVARPPLPARRAGKIQRLKLDEAAVQDRAGGLSGALVAERRALAERQAELARLSSAASALPGDVDAARAKEEAVKEQLAATRGEYEAREGEVRHQLNELTRGLAAFERLGLAFEKVGDDRVRLVFSALSDAAPDARASLAVHVTADNAYVVTDVAPRMREGALEGLVADLNAPDDHASFSRFVQLARREFKRAVAGGAR